MTTFALNVKAIEQEMGLSQKAADEAMRERPQTTDTQLDIYQQNVVDYISNAISGKRQAALEELNSLELERQRIEKEVENFSLAEVTGEAEQKIDRLHAEWKEILDNAKHEEGSALRSYRRFLHDHKLNRKPCYPDSQVLHWAIVILAVLAESIVNSFFFANSSDLGLLGGLFQALFVSLSNIGTALLIGIYVLPYKNHVNSKKQFRAKLTTFFYIIFIFLFNFGAAHYRTLLEDDPLNAQVYIFIHMIKSPMDINFESWNLLIIGMLFAVIAMIKGYKSDDVYPGFGQMHRNLMNTANHSGKRIEAMKAVNRLIDDCTKQAENSVRHTRQKTKSYKDSIFQSREVVSGLAKQIDSAEALCNNVLWEYRNANLSVRSSPPPTYFSQKESFNNYLLEIDTSKDDSVTKRIEQKFDGLQSKEMKKLRSDLRKINKKALEDVTEFFKKAS